MLPLPAADTPIRAVIFDLDGTLADTLPLCIAAFRLAIEPAAGRVLSEAEIIATFGPSEEGTIQALAPDHYPECLAAYLRHYERLHEHCPAPFPGIPALLQALRDQGLRLGLVTGKGAESTRLSLRHFGLEEAFDALETGSPLGGRKREALQHLLTQWGLAPQEAVYIGDSPSDITDSQAVGIPVVAAAWAATADAAALQALCPDAVADSLDGLRAWLWPRLLPPPDADRRPTDWLAIAQRLQALAQAGLAYALSVYDTERYEELHALSLQMMAGLTGEPVSRLSTLFAGETGYPTPKVDIRAVLFRGADEILLVREKVDGGRWSLPGGWADVGYTPFEVAVKEVREETGLEAEAVRLLALFDKKKHPHPPEPWYVYKAFILCRPVGGALRADTAETTGARWVSRTELPHLALSMDRVTHSQLELMWAFAHQPALPTLCD
ncbi:NUDIX hydrolase N-terminal domain-containing protein [Hymenobacter sp. B81]|uniref:NUDIX hydrolase N-terminal domain-containing protein n=1 Tax=Hymenobacter sp. B81 TaxID=3344878 RepID=UPI0037DD05A4